MQELLSRRTREGRADDNWLVRKDGRISGRAVRPTALRDEAGRRVPPSRRSSATSPTVAALTMRCREADRRKDEFLATLARTNFAIPLRTDSLGPRLMQRADSSNADWQRARDIMDRSDTPDDATHRRPPSMSRITQGRMVLQRQNVELNTVLSRD